MGCKGEAVSGVLSTQPVGMCARSFLCSKSTLLDLLAGRKTAGRLQEGGLILFNGRRPTAALLRRDGEPGEGYT